MASLQQFNQIRRCACFEPIVAELIIFKCVEQAERVIYADGIFYEMITVVILFEFSAGFLICHGLYICQLMKFFFQVVVYLLFGNTTDIDIGFTHGNVV